MNRPVPDPVGPGQESVWDYPRPPLLERVERSVRVEAHGRTIAVTDGALRVLETSHPPTYYLPPDAIDPDALVAVGGGSFCEWKGVAAYFDVVTDAGPVPRAAWSYPEPSAAFAELRDHVSFYPALLDCLVDGIRVTPQPGRFYGGWVTPEVVGPFKGIAGSDFW